MASVHPAPTYSGQQTDTVPSGGAPPGYYATSGYYQPPGSAPSPGYYQPPGSVAPPGYNQPPGTAPQPVYYQMPGGTSLPGHYQPTGSALPLGQHDQLVGSALQHGQDRPPGSATQYGYYQVPGSVPPSGSHQPTGSTPATEEEKPPASAPSSGNDRPQGTVPQAWSDQPPGNTPGAPQPGFNLPPASAPVNGYYQPPGNTSPSGHDQPPGSSSTGLQAGFYQPQGATGYYQPPGSVQQAAYYQPPGTAPPPGYYQPPGNVPPVGHSVPQPYATAHGYAQPAFASPGFTLSQPYASMLDNPAQAVAGLFNAVVSGGYPPPQPHGATPVATPVAQPGVAAAQDPANRFVTGRWSVGLCDCFTTCVPNLFMACCCPCVSLAQVYARMALGSYWIVLIRLLVFFTGSFILQIVLSATGGSSEEMHGYWDSRGNYVYGVEDSGSSSTDSVWFFLIQFAVASHVLRARMRVRQRFQIPGSCCGDCLTAWCCSCCAIAQMATHVKSYTPGTCSFGPPDVLPAFI